MNGYEALHTDAAWIDLSSRGKLRLVGEDRARLLHAMSTNNVKDLKENEGLYAFFLSSQGRILADSYIYNLGDSLLLDTEPETAAKLAQHLDKYIIADDAEIRDETELMAAVGLEGPQSYRSATALGIPVPENTYALQSWESGFVVRLSGTGPDGLRLFLPQERLSELKQRFESASLLEATPEEARLVRLEHGIPRYGEDISERYLVQETEALHAVHPNKGCYLGQEIVERVRSRAQVHRHLKSIRIKDSLAPQPGTKLVMNGKDVGEITSAAWSPRQNQVVAMAYVRTEATVGNPDLTVAGTVPPAAAYLA